jgi:hypothetical protein
LLMTNRPDNPWQRLSRQAPFLLPEDAVSMADFSPTATEDLALRLELLPEPYLGSPEAPVVLLNLNPGYSPEDQQNHEDPLFTARCLDNLIHRPVDYPFYLLDPSIKAPGQRWWDRKLGPLIQRVGRQTVARGVLCVEYFPYHSRRFRHWRLSLPSQQYSFALVRQAISRGALVLLLRSERLWFAAVPELRSYERRYNMKSVQNPTVSPRNCPEGFELSVRALDEMPAQPIV